MNGLWYWAEPSWICIPTVDMERQVCIKRTLFGKTIVNGESAIVKVIYELS